VGPLLHLFYFLQLGLFLLRHRGGVLAHGRALLMVLGSCIGRFFFFIYLERMGINCFR